MRYLVAVQHPHDFDGSRETRDVIDDIDALNDEMVAANIRLFVGGLQPIGLAKSVRESEDGELVVTDGPYLETKEHLGGFWVLEAASMDEALEWARKASKACRAGIEVRQFN